MLERSSGRSPNDHRGQEAMQEAQPQPSSQGMQPFEWPPSVLKSHLLSPVTHRLMQNRSLMGRTDHQTRKTPKAVSFKT